MVGFVGTISGRYIHTCANRGLTVADPGLVTATYRII
jgi:hypothetical protein